MQIVNKLKDISIKIIYSNINSMKRKQKITKIIKTKLKKKTKILNKKKKKIQKKNKNLLENRNQFINKEVQKQKKLILLIIEEKEYRRKWLDLKELLQFKQLKKLVYLRYQEKRFSRLFYL